MPSLPPETIPRKRFLGFLIWQSIPSTLLFFLFKFIFAILTLGATNSTSRSSSPVLGFLISFILFELSQLLFSASLSTLSSPRLDRPASPLDLVKGLCRLATASAPAVLPELRRRAELSLSIAGFVAACAVSGFVSVASMSWVLSGGGFSVRALGFRGFAVGLCYGLFYVYKQRWVLKFPIVQRPLFFSFKMGVPSASMCALLLSLSAYFFTAAVALFAWLRFKSEISMGSFFLEVIFCIGSFAVFLCWELSHHLHQVLHAKRFVFAPPRGSAAAETNPSEPLLAALEDSSPGSLVQYLGYLDLCMVCENNVDTWRRAAFFEESGETYKRVMAVCLRPLEQLAAKLGEALETTTSVDKTFQQSTQLLSLSDIQLELLNNYQLCAWSARTVASLTARSHNEDRFGVAQLSGSNAAAVSTLLSCLLAIESFLGKKTHLQSSDHLVGPGGIRWAPPNTGRREFPSSVAGKKKGSPLHSKAYAISDILRVSIYQIVSSFHDEMQGGAKSGLLERDWIVTTKPTFGTRDLLVQKLRLFLDFRAC